MPFFTRQQYALRLNLFRNIVATATRTNNMLQNSILFQKRTATATTEQKMEITVRKNAAQIKESLTHNIFFLLIGTLRIPQFTTTQVIRLRFHHLSIEAYQHKHPQLN